MIRASTRLTMLTAPCHSGSLYAIVNNKSRRAVGTAIRLPRVSKRGGSGALDVAAGRAPRSGCSPATPLSRHGDAAVVRRIKSLFLVIVDPYHFLIGRVPTHEQALFGFAVRGFKSAAPRSIAAATLSSRPQPVELPMRVRRFQAFGAREYQRL